MDVIGEEQSLTVESTGKKRMIAFYVVTALFALLFTLMLSIMAPVLPAAVTGWFQAEKFGAHQFHETVAGVLLWTVPVGLLLQFFRPAQRVAAMQQVLVVLLGLNVAILAGQFSFPPMLVFLALAVVVAALHPARGKLLPARAPDWRLLGMAVAAAIPLLALAAQQIDLQTMAVPGDEHAEFGHWVLMGGYALAIVLLSLTAAFKRPGWRVPAWSAGGLAMVYGLGSLVMRGQASTTNTAWALAAMVWGALFIALSE
ncbi:MAG TPA: hypothetical protein VK879_05565 [Candidatus Sulfomarinibacteraceae bacterium]|nr:hypothetical protein [Candidatus Sulfomarinibacteraceae bacterium]